MSKEFKIEFSKKQIISISLFTTIIYGLFLYFFNVDESLKSIAIQAVIYGILMTLFFIFIFPWFMKKLVGKRINTITPELIENEIIEEEIFSNLFRGLEGVGGKIFLTNQRLIFKSHTLNIQKGQTNIKFSEILSIEKRKTMKFIDNGIKITTKDDKEYCFVLNERDAEIIKIKEKVFT